VRSVALLYNPEQDIAIPMLSYQLFSHYLFSRHAGALVRRIAWICLSGIAIGVFSLVVVVNVMNGFHADISARLLSVEPHLVVTWPRMLEADEIRASHVFKELQSSGNGVVLDVVDQQDVIIRTVDGFFGGAAAKGLSAETFRNIRHRLDRKNAHELGTPLPDVDSEIYNLEAGEVVIGSDLARALAIMPGDRLVVIPPETLLLPPGEMPIFDTVTVREVIVTSVADIDAKGFFYLRDSTLARLRGAASRETALEVRLSDPFAFVPLKNYLERQGVLVESWIDRNSALFFALKLEKTAMSIFLGLSTLIASFAIVSVLVLLMTQKRRDIGILMSMGLSRRRTVNVFAGVGMLLAGIGIAAGLISGLAVSYYLEFFPLNLLPDIYYNSKVPAKVDLDFILWVGCLSVILAFVAAWFPARSHVRRTPVDALRGPAL
jgi:lipoprotein-releasing system permease protein